MPPKNYDVICEQIKTLSERVEKIENNHLAHIQDSIHELGKQITELRIRIAYYMGAAAVLSTLLGKLMDVTVK